MYVGMFGTLLVLLLTATGIHGQTTCADFAKFDVDGSGLIPVASMCTASQATGRRVIVDTYTAEGQTKPGTCSCTATVTLDSVASTNINLSPHFDLQPNYANCGSRLVLARGDTTVSQQECYILGSVSVNNGDTLDVSFDMWKDPYDIRYCMVLSLGARGNIALTCSDPSGGTAGNTTTTTSPTTTTTLKTSTSSPQPTTPPTTTSLSSSSSKATTVSTSTQLITQNVTSQTTTDTTTVPTTADTSTDLTTEQVATTTPETTTKPSTTTTLKTTTLPLTTTIKTTNIPPTTTTTKTTTKPPTTTTIKTTTIPPTTTTTKTTTKPPTTTTTKTTTKPPTTTTIKTTTIPPTTTTIKTTTKPSTTTTTKTTTKPSTTTSTKTTTKPTTTTTKTTTKPSTTTTTETTTKPSTTTESEVSSETASSTVPTSYEPTSSKPTLASPLPSGAGGENYKLEVIIPVAVVAGILVIFVVVCIICARHLKSREFVVNGDLLRRVSEDVNAKSKNGLQNPSYNGDTLPSSLSSLDKSSLAMMQETDPACPDTDDVTLDLGEGGNENQDLTYF